MIVQNPLTGRSSGKFAGAIFSTVFGKNIARSKPVTVRDKKSSAQLAQREKFNVAQQWIIMFLAIIRTGFASIAEGKSAYAAALSWYLKNCITGSFGSYAIDYPNARFIHGNMPTISDGIISDNSFEQVLVTFTENTDVPPASTADDVNLIIFNVNTGSMIHGHTGGSRGTENCSYTGSIGSVGDTIHVWAYPVSMDGTYIGDEIYCGSAVLYG